MNRGQITSKAVPISRRALDIKPFYVMEVLEKAQVLEAQGIDIVHMEVGEPDFDSPKAVVDAGCNAMQAGQTHYTHSMGIVELRKAIANWHRKQYQTEIDPECIIATSGTSPAMLLAFMAICEPGDEVIISDPHYACYPNLISFAGGTPVKVPVFPENGFQFQPEDIAKAITKRTRAILVNSPSNPTGNVMSASVMTKLTELGPLIVSDEIYHGLVYEGKACSMREFTEFCVIINGLSKLYAMTGWRLGYLIVPPEMSRPVQKMQQNFFISALHFGQTAAISALNGECDGEVRNMVFEYDRRRKLILSRLQSLGLKVAVEPTGAFYVFADARNYCKKLRMCAYDLAFDILEKAHVALTPGTDFGEGGEGYLRFSYATSFNRIEEGLMRLHNYFRARK